MRDENDNSGVFVRIPIEPREEWMPVHYGYEVQIDNHPETSGEDEYHQTGMLYSLTKPLVDKAWKPGPEWNTMDITLDGTRTIVTLNGQKVTDFKEGDPVPAKKFDFEPQRGPRPNVWLVRAAESQRQRHRVLQRSRNQAAEKITKDASRSRDACNRDKRAAKIVACARLA